MPYRRKIFDLDNDNSSKSIFAYEMEKSGHQKLARSDNEIVKNFGSDAHGKKMLIFLCA